MTHLTIIDNLVEIEQRKIELDRNYTWGLLELR